MKNDRYLNLCLEQAVLSSLRYRHGCIIVKGGKVIGRGFNDYRRGYDGGALKTGRLSSRKSSLREHRPETRREHSSPGTSRVGVGCSHANVPLSMHSEMMAINSALSSSNNLSVSNTSQAKPYFKLLRSVKTAASRLRQSDSVQSYVRNAGLAAMEPRVQQREQPGSSEPQEWRL